ncbi:MAG TPA: hypothetical protein VM939_01165 [Gemmatimonadaceae bacterium]|nr:hypothetical protein [Gemmatimonadaceae bacterium]
MTTVTRPEQQKTTRPTRATREAAHTKRTAGEDVVPARGHSTEHLPDDFRSITGWGADLDPADRPAVPQELPSDVMTARGDVQHWQQPRAKIHMSNEHPELTPVFGESSPPHGLSGRVRDYAYEYGEGMNRHWMLLILADRIDNFENLIGGLFRGRPDNYVREKAWGTLFRLGDRSQKRRMIMTGAAAALAGALIVTLIVD